MTIGYDKQPLYHQIIYDLTLEESVGVAAAAVFDRAPPHHTSNLRGATIAWVTLASGLRVIDLTAATPDFIDAPSAATGDLDFTVEDWSCAIWIQPDAIAASYLMCRGLLNTNGWYWYFDANGAVHVITNQAAANQDTFTGNGEVIINTWCLLGFSRSGDAINIYKNGLDVTDTQAAHVDPTAVVLGRELHIGIYDDEAAGPLDGSLWRPRIWTGIQLSQFRHWEMFEMERHWFGV